MIRVLVFCLSFCLFYPVNGFSQTEATKKISPSKFSKSNITPLKRSQPQLGVSVANSFTDGDVCIMPPQITAEDIDTHRSMIIHDYETLHVSGAFGLEKTLNYIAQSTGLEITGADVFKKLWATQNDSVSSTVTDAIHCDNDNETINGFPVDQCPRVEGNEAEALDITEKMNDYKPLALVNRLDLADQGWKNCGEHRIIYTRSASAIIGPGDPVELPFRNLVILEAVLPNPKPGCRSGCRDVIEFWAGLSAMPGTNSSEMAARVDKIEEFFFEGLPSFAPVVHQNHYSGSTSAAFYGGSQSGQIRTNQFLEQQWRIKEFKTLKSCQGGSCEFDIVPVAVKNSPYGKLWNSDVAENSTHPYSQLAQEFQDHILTQITVDRLGHPDIMKVSFEVPNKFNDANNEMMGDPFPGGAFGGPNELPENFWFHFSSANSSVFADAIAQKIVDENIDLTVEQLVRRAATQSCAGCHSPDNLELASMNPSSTTDILGGENDVNQWPLASRFRHVRMNNAPFGSATASFSDNQTFQNPEFDPDNFNENVSGATLSAALRNVFLPDRKAFFVEEYNKEVCNCVPLSDMIQDKSPHSAVINTEVNELIKTFMATLKNTKNFKEKLQVLRDLEGSLIKAAKHITIPKDMDSRKAIEAYKFSKFDEINAIGLSRDQYKLKIVNDIEDNRSPRETVRGTFGSH